MILIIGSYLSNMKSTLILFYLLIFNSLPQSSANVISKDMDFEVTANFDHPGYQSWIITVLTPHNKTTSYDGCNTHSWQVDFDFTVVSGSNFSFVILEDETIDEQSNVSYYASMENVLVVQNIEQGNSTTRSKQLPFPGGDPKSLKIILYYEGSGVGSLSLTGILIEWQTLRYCREPIDQNIVIILIFVLVVILVVRYIVDRSKFNQKKRETLSNQNGQ